MSWTFSLQFTTCSWIFARPTAPNTLIFQKIGTVYFGMKFSQDDKCWLGSNVNHFPVSLPKTVGDDWAFSVLMNTWLQMRDQNPHGLLETTNIQWSFDLYRLSKVLIARSRLDQLEFLCFATNDAGYLCFYCSQIWLSPSNTRFSCGQYLKSNKCSSALRKTDILEKKASPYR